jgi:hypothetical protein
MFLILLDNYLHILLVITNGIIFILYLKVSMLFIYKGGHYIFIY